jgi:hypothetical protein
MFSVFILHTSSFISLLSAYCLIPLPPGAALTLAPSWCWFCRGVLRAPARRRGLNKYWHSRGPGRTAVVFRPEVNLFPVVKLACSSLQVPAIVRQADMSIGDRIGPSLGPGLRPTAYPLKEIREGFTIWRQVVSRTVVSLQGPTPVYFGGSSQELIPTSVDLESYLDEAERGFNVRLTVGVVQWG